MVTSDRDSSARRSGRAAQAQGAPEINLILADPARIRVTRTSQRAGSSATLQSAATALSDALGAPPAPQTAEPRHTRIETPPHAVPESVEPHALVATSVAIEQLHASRLRSRTPYDEEAIRTLAASIETSGWTQPILVRPHPVISREYEIVVGELPFRAARFAGLERLPVVVCTLSDHRALECVLLEDIQRPDLAPLEIAVGYGQLIRTFGYTLADLAKLAGKSERQVARVLLMLDRPEAAREAPEDVGAEPLGQPPSSPMREISAVAGASDRPSRAPGPLSAELAALERHLSDALGLKVEMRAQGGRGAVQIFFSDFAQLEWLARHLSSFGLRSGRAPKYPGLAA